MKKNVLFLLVIILGVVCIGQSQERGLKVIKTKQGEKIQLYKGAYAFIVGNGNYRNGWSSLPGALKDVDEIAAFFERMGYDITLKKNLDKRSFEEAFTEFSSKYGEDPENQLLIYFSGHGHTHKMANDEELGYIVMVDAPLPEKDLWKFRLSSVDLQYFILQSKLMKARHVLFVFDSCFSGTILNLRNSGVEPAYISDSVKYPTRQFITAGRAGEKVPDRSHFKQAFLDLLEGRDNEPYPDGYITGEELGFHLKNKVPEYNPNQHPQVGKINDAKLNKGDYVFVRFKETKSGFRFPKQIRFKYDENVIEQSELYLSYKEKTNNPGMSILSLSNLKIPFVWFTTNFNFCTYIWSSDSSLFSSYVLDEHKVVNVTSIRRVKEVDGKKKMEWINKRGKEESLHEDVFTYPVIDILSSCFISSKRVATGEHTKRKRFNIINGRKLEIVEMKYVGDEELLRDGKVASTKVLALSNVQNELLRMNILKDEDGYCYPLCINLKFGENVVELKADKIYRNYDNIVEDPYLKVVEIMYKTPLNIPPSGNNLTYITHLSFMDAMTQSTMIQTEISSLINDAVVKGMNMGSRENNSLAINGVGHLIPNTDANVNHLVNITFDPNLTKMEKIKKIIDELMNPHKIDVIVTGQYIDDARNPMISIRPLIIVKSDMKIVTKNLQFKKDELLCQDPISRKKILCRGAFDQIAQAVQELLEQL